MGSRLTSYPFAFASSVFSQETFAYGIVTGKIMGYYSVLWMSFVPLHQGL